MNTVDLNFSERMLHCNHVADSLYDELVAGRLSQIGMDETEAACDAAWIGPVDAELREDLLRLIIRRIVERV